MNREYPYSIPKPSNFCGGNFQDWLEVNLTSACNAKCSWCIEKIGWHPTHIAPWEEIAETILKTDRKNIILLGGEPTLYRDLSKLSDFLLKNGKEVWITTNGSKLEKTWINENIPNITGVNISIHHFDLNKNKEITGIGLDLAVLSKAIAELLKNGVKIRFNCNCISGYIDTTEKIFEYIQFAKGLMVKNVRFAELKLDTGSFVDLAKLFNYQYGLNDDPFTNGCWQETLIDGVSVNFRQMCGLQTECRKRPENPKQYEKTVVYYDGKAYKGWQLNGEHQMEEMKEEELLTLLRDVESGKRSISEANAMINAELKRLKFLLGKRPVKVKTVTKTVPAVDTSCRY